MPKYFVLSLAFAIAALGCSGEAMAGNPFDHGENAEGNNSAPGAEVKGQAVVQPDQAHVGVAMGDKVDEGLPMGIKLYPGADVQISMAGVGEGQSEARVVFKTGDSIEKVVDFYRNELENKDIGFRKEIRSGEMHMIGGEWASGEAVHVSVTKSPDGATTATIVTSGGS